MKYTLYEYLRHQTESLQLCTICEGGWTLSTCWIDPEDRFIIPQEYKERFVKDAKQSTLHIFDNKTSKYVDVPVLKIELMPEKQEFDEIKHGHWIVNEDEYKISTTQITCSACGKTIISSELSAEEMLGMTKYCMNCGAKMDRDKPKLEILGATLLSIYEAEKLPERLRKHNCWWWLRSPGPISYWAANVFANGSINNDGFDVVLSSGMVRPALLISNLESFNLKIGDIFEFGGKNFEIISDTLAFCLSDIGYYCFNCYSSKGNNYELSDIKHYVDNWFRTKKDEKEKKNG